MSDQELMTVEMAEEIGEIIQFRQEKFDEPLSMALMMVLLNYGDGRRVAHCVAGDWSGPKSDLAVSPTGLPLCPRCGKPCTEEARGWRLALIEEDEESDV